MTETRLVDLGDSLYVIDAWMDGQPERLACYLFDTPERVLVEVGPSSTLHHLVAALDRLGVDDLATIVVTHVHLDHAGGTGHLAARFPDAKVAVHHRGLAHLADPERLWRSAARVFGVDELRAMWGTMEPVPTEQLLGLRDGDTVPLGGGRMLDVIDTPGHAPHHVAFHDATTGGMFVGDAVGVCYPHGHMVQPVTPPPDFDPEEVIVQLRRMAARRPGFVGFAHFGPRHDPDRVFAEAEDRLREWVEFVVGLAELSVDEAADALRRWTLGRYLDEGIGAGDVDQYDAKTFWPMQIDGIRRWLDRRRP